MKKLALVLAAVMVASCMLIVPTAATSGADVLASADMYLTFEDESYADTKGNYSVITADSSFGIPEAKFAEEGKFGGSIETSQNSFLVVEDLVFGADSYTISAWTKIVAYNGSDPVLFGNKDWSGGGNPGMILCFDDGTYYVCATANDERINHKVDVADTQGVWTHVAIVVDRANGSQTLYINGVPNTVDVIAWADDVMDSDYAFTIGDDGTGMYNGDNLVMNFDEFAFFKKALTMAEVHAIYEYAPEGYEAATAPEVNLPDYSAPLTYTANPADVVAAADVYIDFEGDLADERGNAQVANAWGDYYGKWSEDATEFHAVDPVFVEGAKGQALATNTNENYVFINEFSVGAEDSFTYSAWIKLIESDGEWQPIFGKANGVGNTGSLGMFGNSTFGFFSGAWGYPEGHRAIYTEASYINSPVANRYNTWNHFAIVGDRAANTVTVYMNGRAVATQSYAGLDQGAFPVDGGTAHNNAPIVWLTLNAQGPTTSIGQGYLKADFDEVALYKKALSADEMAALYSYVAAPADDSGDDEPSATEGLLGADLIGAADLYLAFDENLTDAAGKYTVTSNEGDTSFVSGKVGSAAHIEGGVNYLTVDGLTFGADSFTVSTWVNVASFDGDPCLFSNQDWDSADNEGFTLAIDGWGDGYRFAGNVAGASKFSIGTGIDTTGEWVHLTAVVDRAAGVATLYINGVAFETTGDISGFGNGILGDTVNNYVFNIGEEGQGNYNSSGSLTADFDEFMVFKSALTADQVASLYGTYSAENPDVDPGTPDEPDAPQTFDIAIVAAVASIISLAGYAIAKKH